jgi:uncharacterized protein UPF0175
MEQGRPSPGTPSCHQPERTIAMDVTLHIPDEFAQRLKAAGGDLSRRALEALALEEYKLGHLTTAELRGLLGLRTQAEMEGFLKSPRHEWSRRTR